MAAPALASSSTGPTYHAALRQTLHAETSSAIGALQRQIQTDGYDWLEEYMEGVLAVAAEYAKGKESDKALATILKTPVRTAKKNKTRAIALADQNRQDRAIQANKDLASSTPVTLVESGSGRAANPNPSRLLFAPASRTPSRDKENQAVSFGQERVEQNKTPNKSKPSELRSPRPLAFQASPGSGIPRSPSAPNVARRALLSHRPRSAFDERTASPRSAMRAGSTLGPAGAGAGSRMSPMRMEAARQPAATPAKVIPVEQSAVDAPVAQREEQVMEETIEASAEALHPATQPGETPLQDDVDMEQPQEALKVQSAVAQVEAAPPAEEVAAAEQDVAIEEEAAPDVTALAVPEVVQAAAMAEPASDAEAVPASSDQGDPAEAARVIHPNPEQVDKPADEAEVVEADEPADAPEEPTGTYDLVIPLRDETVTRLSGDRQSRGPNSMQGLAKSSIGPSSRNANAAAPVVSARQEVAPAPSSSISNPRTSAAVQPRTSSWLSRALGDGGQNALRKSLAASAVHKEKLRSVPSEEAVPTEIKAPEAPVIDDLTESRHSVAVAPQAPSLPRESSAPLPQNDTLKALKARLAASQSRPTISGGGSAPASGLQSTTGVGLGGGVAGKFNPFRSTLGHAPLLFARPSGVPREELTHVASAVKGDVEDVEQDEPPVPGAAQQEEATTASADPVDSLRQLSEPSPAHKTPLVEAVRQEHVEPEESVAAAPQASQDPLPAVLPASLPERPVTPPPPAQLELQESTTPTNTPPPIFRLPSRSIPQLTRLNSDLTTAKPLAVVDHVQSTAAMAQAAEAEYAGTAAQPAQAPRQSAQEHVAPMQLFNQVDETAVPVRDSDMAPVPAKVPAVPAPHGLSYSQALSIGDESREEERIEDQEDLAELLHDVTASESDVDADVDEDMEAETAASRATSEAESRPASRMDIIAAPKPKSKPHPEQRESQLQASTQSRAGTSADRLAHAERIANKIHGQKPVVTKPSSLNAAAHARMQHQAAETKRKQQREAMEQRKRQKIEKEQETAAQAAQAAQAERKRRLEEVERRRRERAETEKRLKEAAEREAIRRQEKNKLAVSGEVKVRGMEGPSGNKATAQAEAGKIKRLMPNPNKGKEPVARPPPTLQQTTTGQSSQATGSGLNKSMGPPVRPLQKPSTAGASNPFAAGSGKAVTGGSTISLVKPGPSRTSVQIQAQKNALAQSTMHNLTTPAPKPARDELTRLQRRIAMGGSASPQVRPEDVELPDISSDFGYSSDSEDDRRKAKKAAPTWVDSPEIRQGAQAQQSIDPEDLFGRIPEVVMDDLFPEARKGKFRPRSSSANWGGADRLTKQEEIEYAMRMGYKHLS